MEECISVRIVEHIAVVSMPQKGEHKVEVPNTVLREKPAAIGQKWPHRRDRSSLGEEARQGGLKNR